MVQRRPKKGKLQGNVVKFKAYKYAHVPTSICFERDLSAKALGIYVKIQSLDDDFHFTVEGFSKLFKEGRDSIRSGIRELEEFGYLVRAQRRATGGRYNDDTIWIAMDEPGLDRKLWGYLEENGYDILSRPSREAQRAVLRPNLEDVGSRLKAVEDAYRAELDDYYKRCFDPERRKSLGGQFGLGDTATEAPGDGEGPEVFHTGRIPSSEPMTGFQSPVATCEDSEIGPCLPSSEPMTGFPSSENPTESINSLLPLSTSLGTSTKPTTGTTCQVDVAGEPPRDGAGIATTSPPRCDTAAESAVTEMEEISGQTLDGLSRYSCAQLVSLLMSQGLDQEQIVDAFEFDAQRHGVSVDGWLLDGSGFSEKADSVMRTSLLARSRKGAGGTAAE